MSKKDLEKEINILEHEIFIERVLTRAMGKNTITLRDHFAGMAMQGLISIIDNYTMQTKAIWAYNMADAMLAEREKNEISTT